MKNKKFLSSFYIHPVLDEQNLFAFSDFINASMLVEDKMNFLILLLHQITNPSSPLYPCSNYIYSSLHIYFNFTEI